MRTNIDIGDDRMQRAMAAAGRRTNKAAVEAGLRLPVRLKAPEAVLALEGQVPSPGDGDPFPPRLFGTNASGAAWPTRRWTIPMVSRPPSSKPNCAMSI